MGVGRYLARRALFLAITFVIAIYVTVVIANGFGKVDAASFGRRLRVGFCDYFREASQEPRTVHRRECYRGGRGHLARSVDGQEGPFALRSRNDRPLCHDICCSAVGVRNLVHPRIWLRTQSLPVGRTDQCAPSTSRAPPRGVSTLNCDWLGARWIPGEQARTNEISTDWVWSDGRRGGCVGRLDLGPLRLLQGPGVAHDSPGDGGCLLGPWD